VENEPVSFYTYTLRCADGSFYTGHTDDLEARLAIHNEGILAGYTKTRRPLTLVFSQAFGTRLEALEAERQIKNWSRAKKEALINGDWAVLRELARRRTPDRDR
jgi:predicted GIY-YIG superfamily endonuclease